MCNTLVAAHTGCGVYPDNTMASFDEGIQLGADIVEVDVRVSRDGIAILLHDDSPYLHTHTFEQLNNPVIRSLIDPMYRDHEIATLEQVLQFSDSLGIKLNLDIKSVDAIDPTVRLIYQFEAQKRVFITGCSDNITVRYPDIQVMLNTPDDLSMEQMERYGDFAEAICSEALQGGYVGLNMNGFTCLPPIVIRAHAAGLMVWVYTVNFRPAMEWFLRMHVDAITTREPNDLIALKNELNKL
ncbi:glycerophosphodiester phosphodiesterase [Bacillus sp. FJAT-28004]|uniref:glycerophosphodiester phosphodiesterase n=1 Tax=Bacillus sp. FJAT-28004 TaxID=1679165 RepID=UPI0006B5EF39|nr:glycerophosphodiester phosphodiesterase [Bacillus sp. FJAT-28004]